MNVYVNGIQVQNTPAFVTVLAEGQPAPFVDESMPFKEEHVYTPVAHLEHAEQAVDMSLKSPRTLHRPEPLVTGLRTYYVNSEAIVKCMHATIRFQEIFLLIIQAIT